jgi:predicted O-linked N-acetylglucosamine transferase (SPINDLY family)
MDYRLTDAHQDPPGESEQYHSEQLLRMPQSCWCYMPDQEAPEVAPPPLDRNGYVTFGSLNKLVKVSAPCARIWAQVLATVPGSRLLLAVISEQAAHDIRKRLGALGLPPDRLDLVPKAQTRGEYFQRFGQIDIALDTFPFNGITTSCDGLWMGVPLVSLGGQTTVSRAGQSILNAAGLGELAVLTPEAFVEAARNLADHRRQRELRAGMRQRVLGSALMDHVGFTRALESEYERIWKHWQTHGQRQAAEATR